jgi:Mg-chelatase subunit ChlD
MAMRFLEPEIGWAIVATLAVVGILQWRLRRRFAASATVSRLFARTYRASAVRRLPFALLVAGIALAGCALMDPVLPYSQAQVRTRGVEIVVVLDLSSSMQEDIAPGPGARGAARVVTASSTPPGSARLPTKTRLEATKDAVRAFVRARQDDRIGLVVFSDRAYVVSPLTFDHDYLINYIDMVDDRILQGEGKTAIGDGLALANVLLARQSASGVRSHQIVMLFTDGENNKGRDPAQVLEELTSAGVRVHFIGVDLEQEVQGKPEVQHLLRQVRRDGGQYFNATTARDLAEASRAVDAVEKDLLVNTVTVHDAPVYQWFAIPALLLVAAALGLRAVPYFIDQT